MAGIVLAGVVFAVILAEYSGSRVFIWAAAILSVIAVGICCLGVRLSRISFVLIGLALTLWAGLTHDDWMSGVARAAISGSLITGMFTALVALRSAAMGSREILECGRFLARQRPGLRYAALSMGGHLFGLILLYGAISLLGSMAVENTVNEADAEIRRHRLRRMLVAIQRGFAATICWSPMAFSMVISIVLVPGARWNDAVLPCLVSAALLLLGGWALDTIFKPKLAHPRPLRPQETGHWLVHLRPLLLLLSVVAASAMALHFAFGVEVIGAVISLIPVLAILWCFCQTPPQGQTRKDYVVARIGQFLFGELPGYRGEIVLLFMAAFIGNLGAFVLVPLIQAWGIDLSALPAWLILIALIWIIPVTGQMGMNPILAVSLLVPLLPPPDAMGVSAAAVVTAITGGWALSGSSSPFTASILLVGSLGKIAPRKVGLVWNGPYVLIMGVLLSGWVLILAGLG